MNDKRNRRNRKIYIILVTVFIVIVLLIGGFLTMNTGASGKRDDSMRTEALWKRKRTDNSSSALSGKSRSGETSSVDEKGRHGKDRTGTGKRDEKAGKKTKGDFTADTRVRDVMNDPVFKGYGRLIFPVDQNIPKGLKLSQVSQIMTWYNYVNTDKTVEIVNYMKDQASSGKKIFYDIYTDAEKKEDPDKENTGLFFFRGNKNAKTAIVNAGGGFMYVGAMHDSFPHALELSKKGYNAFALIYRPGAQTACEDLSRAIAFLEKNADKLGIDMTDYSLWGGSAGARMAAWVGTYGTHYFGEKRYPQPAAVIMEYTGLSEVTGKEPPTMAFVGTGDSIADYRVMRERIHRIKQNGTDADIRIYKGLPHGFGLGQGTVAEGWINEAVRFWERNMK